MAITETMGPYGITTAPQTTRRHESENINYRNAKMENPVVQNYHLLNNHYNTPKIAMPQMEDKTRKEKKWSIGKLFRRKKKEESDSSSESDNVNSKSETKRKKISKKSQFNNNLDIANRAHNRRAQSVTKIQSKEFVDEGILSDPSAGFVGFIGRGLPRLPQDSHLTSRDSLDKRGAGSSCGSQDGSLRKGRKGRMKARVEAIRNSMRHDSSSDEGSQKSSTSSSIMRFRSDDSLTNSKDGSFNKKTRSARTERYIKRLSRDDENQLNKEAELLKKGHSKSEIELIMKNRSASNDYCNVETIKTDHNNCYANIERQMESIKVPKLSNSISSVQSFSPASIQFNATINDENVTYSVPYQNGLHSRQSYNTPISDNVSYNSLNSSYDNENIMVVKFPIGVNAPIKVKEEKAPPVPPRDPQRRLTTPVSGIYENSRYGQFNQNNILRNHSHGNIAIRRPISSSEDHIAIAENYYMGRPSYNDKQQPRRPASVSAEPTKSYQNHLMYRNIGENKRTTLPCNINNQADLIYYADQTPRSRKPIHIRTSHSNLDQRYLSDSQSSLPQSEQMAPQVRPKNATEFWRKIDNEENERRKIHNLSRTKALSDQTNISGIISPNNFIHQSYRSFHNSVIKPTACRFDSAGKPLVYRQNNMRVPSQDEVDNVNSFVYPERYSNNISQKHTITSVKPHLAHMRHKSESYISSAKRPSSDDEKTNDSRKSTNLDEALNELEAIYNSLGLGDEDLLERAEKREQMSAKYAPDSKYFNYNGIPNVVIRPYINNQHQTKRILIPDKVHDDMAYRRFNFKEKSNPKDLRRLSSNISHTLNSPILSNNFSDEDKLSDTDRQEPDIVLDDVVYRNIKQAKNRLKVIEPQPPFGIPLGPISPSPQNDYLHANPEIRIRPRFISRMSPDLVSDDLAVRTLRKDTKNQLNNDDVSNILINRTDRLLSNDKDSINSVKKKRAVRSLSANIFSMIQKEIDDALNMSRLATMERTQSITDLNKSLKETVSRNKHFDEIKNRKNESSTNKPIVTNKPVSKVVSNNVSKLNGYSNETFHQKRKYTREEFDQAIDVLAQETRDTSDKLGVALAELENMDLTKFKVTNNSALLSSSTKSKDIASKSSELCQKKSDELIENSTENSKIVNPNNVPENISSTGKNTEDSLLAISSQLQIVENKLKTNVENKLNFVDEKKKIDEMTSELKTNIEDELKFIKQEKKLSSMTSKLQDTIDSIEQIDSESMSTQNTPHSQVEDNSVKINTEKNNHDFLNEKEKLDELTKSAEDYIKSQNIEDQSSIRKDVLSNRSSFENINRFDDLKNDISNIIHEISGVNAKLNIVSQTFPKNTHSFEDKNAEINETLEYNSSEELASIFNSEDKSINEIAATQNKETNSDKNCSTKNRNDGDLNSPGLVKSIDNTFKKVPDDESPGGSSTCIPHQRQNGSSQSSNCVPWRKNRGQNNPGSSNGGDELSSGKSCSWYRDPGNVMLACSYTLACTQQLAGLDVLTILGLILAMISIVAMLLI